MFLCIKDSSWFKLKIKASREGFYHGETVTLEGKKVEFWFSWSAEETSQLKIKGVDERILEFFVHIVGKPQIKWKKHSLFSVYTMYVWEKKPEKVKLLYASLCLAETGQRFFKCSDIELL